MGLFGGTASVTPEDWAPQLRQFRRLRAIKQIVLAEMAGVDQATISRWERGRTIPDSAMQKRLCSLMRRTPNDEALLRHWIKSSPAQVVLSTPDRIIVAASSGYAAAHGVAPDEIVGMSTRPMYTEENEFIWQRNRQHGFYRGEVASTLSVLRARRLLSGQLSGVKVLWTPVKLSDGRILLRGERTELSDEQFAFEQAAIGGAVRIVRMDALVL
jgi:transcriptional regulator with XRE-family HTH domain